MTAPPLRLLTVGSLPPEWGGPERGGVATFHAALLEGLRDRRDEIEVVGVLPPRPPAREPPIRVLARPGDVRVADFYERALAEERPAVVLMNHVANTIGVTHRRLGSPVPAVGIVHSWHNITFRAGEERQRAWDLTQEALDGLAALVVPSRHCLREGESLGLRYPEATAVVHYPLQPLYLAGDIHVTGGERRGAVYLGSLIERKNPGALVEAAARLSGLEATLVGHGQLEDELRESIRRLSLDGRVKVAPLGDDDHLLRVRDLLLGAEVMCLPSRSESFGIVFIEALACGTPIVGFGPTVREIRDAIGIDIGVPLDDGAPEEVAAGIERVLAGRWDREELRRRCLEAFGLALATDRYVDVLGTAAARRPVAEAP
jgi:glycosyltransferase involved in cell wall biosynthesis